MVVHHRYVEIDVEKYALLCRSTHRIIIETFHSLELLPLYIPFLTNDHSWEWIKWNGGRGLLKWSEDGIEAGQKRTRNNRKFRCFFGSTRANLIQAHELQQLRANVYLNHTLNPWTKPSQPNKHRVDETCPEFLFVQKDQ